MRRPCIFLCGSHADMARRFSICWRTLGAVPKRPKGEVCKTSIRGFESHPRLQTLNRATLCRARLARPVASRLKEILQFVHTCEMVHKFATRLVSDRILTCATVPMANIERISSHLAHRRAPFIQFLPLMDIQVD